MRNLIEGMTLLTLALALVVCARMEVWGEKSFSTFAVQDEEKMKLMIGTWIFTGRPYAYEFTDEFVRRVDGFPYFRYKVSQYPRNTYLYSVFKSKMTGKLYFCRGKWDSRYGFQYSSSRIEFRGKDLFIVYSKDEPGEVYFIADRIKKKDNKISKVARGNK